MLLAAVVAAGCTPARDLDYGPTGDVNLPPADALSAQVLKEFRARDFLLGRNNKTAEVSLPQWPKGKIILLPFWLGVNPVYPWFHRPILGRIYVISEALMVRPLGDNNYLIRAGSLMFKGDTLFEARYVKYSEKGKMLPFIVRFVGTRIITVPKDAPAKGTITEKVLVLREVSLPMRTKKPLPGYAAWDLLNPPAGAGSPAAALKHNVRRSAASGVAVPLDRP